LNNRQLAISGSVFFFLFHCIGCTHQAYVGNTKSYKDIAVINDSSTLSLRQDRASIAAVDDKRWRLSAWSMPAKVEVLPGQHSVAIYCWHGFEPSSNAGLQGRLESINFNAQTGHDYQVYCSVKDGRYVRWVKDITTGEIVGGIGNQPEL